MDDIPIEVRLINNLKILLDDSQDKDSPVSIFLRDDFVIGIAPYSSDRDFTVFTGHPIVVSVDLDSPTYDATDWQKELLFIVLELLSDLHYKRAVSFLGLPEVSQ
jgi:hypothetical protein